MKKHQPKPNLGVRDLKIVRQKKEIQEISLNLGPHYSLRIKGGPHPSISLTVTHHGVTLDASEINGELEKAIYRLRKVYPRAKLD
jgi:hypothetical protein